MRFGSRFLTQALVFRRPIVIGSFNPFGKPRPLLILERVSAIDSETDCGATLWQDLGGKRGRAWQQVCVYDTCQSSGRIPLLVRRGGRDIKKMPRSLL